MAYSLPRGECRAIGGQAALASSEAGLTAWNSWQKLEPSLPLKPAHWSRRSAPRRDQRIGWDLVIRRLTRKLAVPSVSDAPREHQEPWGNSGCGSQWGGPDIVGGHGRIEGGEQ